MFIQTYMCWERFHMRMGFLCEVGRLLPVEDGTDELLKVNLPLRYQLLSTRRHRCVCDLLSAAKWRTQPSESSVL